MEKIFSRDLASALLEKVQSKNSKKPYLAMQVDIRKILETLSEYRKLRNHYIPDTQTVILGPNGIYQPLHLIDQDERHFHDLGRLLRHWHRVWNAGARRLIPEISGSMDYELNTLLPICPASGAASYNTGGVKQLQKLTGENVRFLKRHISEAGLELIQAAREKMPRALQGLVDTAGDDAVLHQYGYEALKQALWHDPHVNVDMFYWQRMIDCVTILKEAGVPSTVLVETANGTVNQEESVMQYLAPEVRRHPLPSAIKEKIKTELLEKVFRKK